MIASTQFGTAISITEHENASARTDQLDSGAATSILLGLFGEVGSLMATSKKYHREGDAYVTYRDAVVEEFGDVLWYLTALCRRSGIKLDEIIEEILKTDDISTELFTGTLPSAPIASVRSFARTAAVDDLLLELGQRAAALLGQPEGERVTSLREFTIIYLRAVQAFNIPLAVVAQSNLAKVTSRFLEFDPRELPVFDEGFPEDERLPSTFRIEIRQRASGQSYMRWNGVFIGDPLTDNIEDGDGYRFHDVFHFAHAAVLHWSPTFRSLIRHKRKSVGQVDENQDGGRAIVIEEGLTAYIFSCAKELNFFHGQGSVSFDLLKTIRNFVRGYEVEKCPLKLWEDAILQGYAVFRQLKRNNGGVVVGDRGKRRISYEGEECDR